MSTSLAVRYHFGLTGWPSHFSPEGEVVYGIPQLVALGERQLAAMRQLHVAEAAVANEIAEQGRSLEAILRGIEAGSDQVSAAIDLLGDRVCADLCEIKWQLAQQGKVLERILKVLLQSRNNEAKQLVKQGVRHYVNGEFQEAEERFRLALSFDTADYQVLMNLGFIQINKGDASEALKYFKKALSLPENLDAACKARTLWATARLHYAQRNFPEALLSAGEAFKHSDRNDPAAVYALAVYSALAGDKQGALELLEDAIHRDVSHYGKATVDPDLDGIRGDVLGLLARLAREAEREAKEAFALVAKEFSLLPGEAGRLEFQDLKASTGQHLRQIRESLKKPSYSACRRCVIAMEPMSEVVSGLRELDSATGVVALRSAESYDRHRKRREFQANPMLKPDSKIWLLLYAVSYLASGCVFAMLLGVIDQPYAANAFLSVIWPLLIMPLGDASIGIKDAGTASTGWIGLILAILIQALFFLARRHVKQHYKKLSSLEQAEQSANTARDQAEGRVTAIVELIGQSLQEAARRWSSPISVPPRQPAPRTSSARENGRLGQ